MNKRPSIKHEDLLLVMDSFINNLVVGVRNVDVIYLNMQQYTEWEKIVKNVISRSGHYLWLDVDPGQNTYRGFAVRPSAQHIFSDDVSTLGKEQAV